MAAALALTIFLSRHQGADPSTWILVGVVMLIICIPFAVPAVGDFVSDRPRTIFYAGILLIAGGFVGILGIAFAASHFGFTTDATGTDAISSAVVGIALAGSSLMILPRSIGALKRTDQVAPATKQSQPAKGFSGPDEAWTAIGTVASNWTSFARLFGPWIVLLWLAPFAGLHIVAYSSGLAPNLIAAPVGKMDIAIEILAEGLPLLAASIFAFPIALVGWHRYLRSGVIPTFGLRVPTGDVLRYLWRLWMILLLYSVLARLVASNAPDVAGVLGTSNTLLVAELLFWGAFCLGVYAGSSFALVLPAIADGNRSFTGTDAVRISKPLGHSFRAGFVLSFLPFALAYFGAVELLNRLGISGPRLSLASYSLWLVPSALLFLALASCATYLSRVYAAQVAVRR